jgi:YegS/Rv2252/BmrU family lipid kinase
VADQRKKIHFIINPISGGKRKNFIPDLIEKTLEKSDFDISIFHTQSTENALEIAEKSANEAEIIVAVGGDGTINNVAQFVAKANKTLGIIPMGSGNGLARELKIPSNPVKALQLIAQQKSIKIDTCTLNDHFFINIAGIGFDAHIANLFSKAKTRGFKTYSKITLGEFAKYKNKNYQLQFNQTDKVVNAFMVCVCNGTQFGNNARTAPKAIFNDGLFDVVIFNKFNLIQVPRIIYQLFFGNVANLPFVETYQTNQINIKALSPEEQTFANIDGESAVTENKLAFKLQQQNLKILVS